jgi:hypothetical protein
MSGRSSLVLLVALVAGVACADDASDRLARIEALRAKKPAWREIAWRSCLLEGLREAREQKKPAILWVFIDRPVDDARC